VDAGTLGLTGDRRIVAFGDFSGDQLYVQMSIVTRVRIIVCGISLDFLSLASDQRTFTVHFWNHGMP